MSKKEKELLVPEGVLDGIESLANSDTASKSEIKSVLKL